MGNVTVNDFIYATIDHLFNDTESGEKTWQREEVVDVDIDSEDQENPDFSVTYNEYESGDKKNKQFLIPLFEDYLKGCIQFVDVYTSSD